MSYLDRIRYRGARPRKVSDTDVALWMDSASERPIPREWVTIKERRAILWHKSPRRWLRMQRDFKWAQRKFLKAGIDPEEVRWLL